MFKRPIYKIAILIFLGISLGHSELTYIPFKKDPFWGADTFYLGLGFIARNAKSPITISWKNSSTSIPGELNLMVPGVVDSARFLFHNWIDSFPSEESVVHVGPFPTGTKIVFMYRITDTNYSLGRSFNKKLYSGQNRLGIDQYVSEIRGLVDFRWAVAGKVNDSTCEMGFGGTYSGSFRDILFHVTNVYREELDKYQPALPVATPSPANFTVNQSITLSSATAGTPKIYYTLDGSMPTTKSNLFTSPIPINKTTTIKAIATMPGDTQWVDSDVMTETYAITAINTPYRQISFYSNANAGNLRVYNIRGQRVSNSHFNQANRSALNGVFVVQNRSNNNCTALRRVIY